MSADVDPTQVMVRELARSWSSPRVVPATTRALSRAVTEGLVEVAYGLVDTPLGALLVAVTAHGLVRTSFCEEGSGAVLDDIARRVSPLLVEVRAPLDQVRSQVAEYFAGRRRDFTLALDWRLVGAGFQRTVLDVTRAIPAGSVLTYSEVAARGQRPSAMRAAGNALAANPICLVVPCHRVVPKGGGVGNYAGGSERKRWLLDHEAASMAG